MGSLRKGLLLEKEGGRAGYLQSSPVKVVGNKEIFSGTPYGQNPTAMGTASVTFPSRRKRNKRLPLPSLFPNYSTPWSGVTGGSAALFLQETSLELQHSPCPNPAGTAPGDPGLLCPPVPSSRGAGLRFGAVFIPRAAEPERCLVTQG